MSIRDITTNSSLGKKRDASVAGLDWSLTEPVVPGPSTQVDDNGAQDPEMTPMAKAVTANLEDKEIADNFLLAYFSMFPEQTPPSDKQLHALAYCLGLEPKGLETQIFAMLERVTDSADLVLQDI